jgi:AcrR family transcriptional regulator
LKTKEIIIEKALKFFLQYGIRCVTMDQIASDLGKSKKTLYKYFKNKDELIESALRFHENLDASFSADINQKMDMDPIEKYFMIFIVNMDHLGDMSQAAIFELKKYYRNFWDTFYERKKIIATAFIEKNLHDGQKMGIYREDLNIEFVANLYYKIVMLIANGGIAFEDKINMKELFRQYFYYHLHAISNEKGKELIDKYNHKYFNN